MRRTGFERWWRKRRGGTPAAVPYFLDNGADAVELTHRDVFPHPLGYDELLRRSIEFADGDQACRSRGDGGRSICLGGGPPTSIRRSMRLTGTSRARTTLPTGVRRSWSGISLRCASTRNAQGCACSMFSTCISTHRTAATVATSVRRPRSAAFDPPDRCGIRATRRNPGSMSGSLHPEIAGLDRHELPGHEAVDRRVFVRRRTGLERWYPPKPKHSASSAEAACSPPTIGCHRLRTRPCTGRSGPFATDDGQGSQFGELSLPASSQRPLSVFASTTSADDRTVVVALNLSADEQLDASIDVASCNREQATAYQYSGDPDGFSPVDAILDNGKAENLPFLRTRSPLWSCAEMSTDATRAIRTGRDPSHGDDRRGDVQPPEGARSADRRPRSPAATTTSGHRCRRWFRTARTPTLPCR